MVMSFRIARNLGLTILLIIIILQGFFSYGIMASNSKKLSGIIANDEVKLRSWYDVAEIIAEAKDKLYDFRMGKSELIAPVDLLINRALKEIEAIQAMPADADEKATIEQIVKTAKRLRQAIYAYGIEVKDGYQGGSAAKEMEEIAVHTADRIVGLGRNAAAYVSLKIEEENKAILKTAAFSQKTLATVMMFAIAATIFAAFFMAYALEKPVKELVEGTLKLSAGDLSHRVRANTNDEFGQLANSFNAMAEVLRRSQLELLAAKTYTDDIISSMTNSLVVVGRDGSIRRVNKATCDLLGYSEAELVGRHASIFISDEIIKGKNESGSIFEEGSRNVETTYLDKDGRKIPVLFASSIIHGEESSFAGAVCVAQDITIQTEAIRASHLASLGEMAAGVAHEINNPINGIINLAQILADDIENKEALTTEIPLRIIKEGDRIATIVRSLLFFARETEKEKAEIRVNDIMNEVLSLTETQILRDAILLEVDFPEELPSIYGNFQQLQQVFLNIINNARYALNSKFSTAHPDKYLIIRARKKLINNQPEIEILFLDYGIGIPENLQAKVMNPFFTTKPAGRGTGLGLAISHGIITDHKGRLNIESSEGEFTGITITLPAITTVTYS